MTAHVRFNFWVAVVGCTRDENEEEHKEMKSSSTVEEDVLPKFCSQLSAQQE